MFYAFWNKFSIWSNIHDSPFVKVKVKGIGCNELAEVFVTLCDRKNLFFSTFFQIVSYMLKMQYKVFDKIVFSYFIFFCSFVLKMRVFELALCFW